MEKIPHTLRMDVHRAFVQAPEKLPEHLLNSRVTLPCSTICNLDMEREREETHQEHVLLFPLCSLRVAQGRLECSERRQHETSHPAMQPGQLCLSLLLS